MGSLLNTLWRTVILDDAAYQEWRERPNVFLRGIILIVVISLVAGLASFAVNLVNQVKPVQIADIDEGINQWLEIQSVRPILPGSGSPAVHGRDDGRDGAHDHRPGERQSAVAQGDHRLL
jgi:hypothetical protein